MKWPYKNHGEDDYKRAVRYVEETAMKYGAIPVSVSSDHFSTYSREWESEVDAEMRVFKYKDEFFRVEPHFLPEKPYMVLSFGDTIETIFEDADPFPYDLSEKELEQEVRYSLGIDEYPESVWEARDDGTDQG